MSDNSDDIPMATKLERAKAMRALSDDAREEAIAAASNVVGFDRFSERSKQVMLRDAYRKPQKPGPGGHA